MTLNTFKVIMMLDHSGMWAKIDLHIHLISSIHFRDILSALISVGDPAELPSGGANKRSRDEYDSDTSHLHNDSFPTFFDHDQQESSVFTNAPPAIPHSPSQMQSSSSLLTSDFDPSLGFDFGSVAEDMNGFPPGLLDDATFAEMFAPEAMSMWSSTPSGYQ